MSYALVENGVVAKWPANAADLAQRHPDVSFPAPLPDSTAATYGLYRVTPQPQPSYNPDLEEVVEVQPQFANGGCLQQWVVRPRPVPAAVSKLGLKYALGSQWSMVKAAIDGDPALKEDWDLAQEIHRDSALVNNTAAALGFTQQQMDDVFRRASGVRV